MTASLASLSSLSMSLLHSHNGGGSSSRRSAATAIQGQEPSSDSLEYRLLAMTTKPLSPSASDQDDDGTATTELLDDDCSDSSSLSSSTHSSSSTSSSRCRVHFDLSANVVYDDNTLQYQQQYLPKQHEPRYDGFEYRDFKRQTYTLSKQLAGIELRNRAPHSYQRTLTRVYQWCCEEAQQNDDLDQELELPVADQKHLTHWANAGPCRLGLDKWSLVDLQKERSHRKRTLKQHVLNVQQQTTSQPNLEERLRQASEQYSRPGRLFARHMAASLAAAEASQTTKA